MHTIISTVRDGAFSESKVTTVDRSGVSGAGIGIPHKKGKTDVLNKNLNHGIVYRSQK